MKTKTIILVVAAAALAASCTPDYSEHTFRGILYTDSTLSAVVPDAELAFRESSGAHGHCCTDSLGRWGFSYVRNLDNPYDEQGGTKFKFEEYFLCITLGDDTVYCNFVSRGYNTNDTVTAYIGYMERFRRPYTIDTTSTTDTLMP